MRHLARAHNIGYKVVRVLPDGTITGVSSTRGFQTWHEAREDDCSNRRYLLNIVVRPAKGFGPLAVFNTEGNARRFMDIFRYPDLRLYRCHYGESKSKFFYTPSTGTRMGENEAPAGTIFASWVMLLEEVPT